MRESEADWMRLCLKAAMKGRGRVSPNPLVGAAVVRDGRLIALGHHSRFGGEHAERMALRRAGRRARGATLYVSLEPCAHQGKTPPCVDSVASAGIRRVVAAMRDPHPLVNGRGLRALRRSGVRVEVGLLGREARKLNAAYLRAVVHGRPLVTLKAGMSLDGKIATAAGRSKWITSPGARRRAHLLRAEHDAVLVGRTTAQMDSPLLTARGVRARTRQPFRVVLDSRLRLSPASPLLTRRGGGPVIVYTATLRPARRARLEKAGAVVVAAGRGKAGVRLRNVLADLARRGIHSLLVEGGGEVAWSFLEEGLADRIAFFVAPRLLGGRSAIAVVGGDGVRDPARAFRILNLRTERVGADLLLTGRIAPKARAAAGGGR